MTKRSDFEGSCPICRIGEVTGTKCQKCGAKFCSKGGGVKNRSFSPNVALCKCPKKKAKK
ncbi:MAG: hypothetical protein WCT37_02365 [Patescibacteria group bacterium]